MKCRICGIGETEQFSLKQRIYLECRDCGSICLSADCLETPENQKIRYEKHHNSLEDDGYRKFLESFIFPVLQEITCDSCKGGALPVRKILDYGSGPEPALCRLLELYSRENRFIDTSTEIRGWDPFFAPDTEFFKEGADLVTCLEVAEHFETPLTDMKKLAGTCAPNGYVAIGTMLIPENSEEMQYGHEKNDRKAFSSWWYRGDSTHVAFYSLEGLKRCAESAGLTYVKSVTDRAFLFRKKV